MNQTTRTIDWQIRAIRYLLTHRHHIDHRHVGVVSNDSVISLKEAGYTDIISVLAGGPEALQKAAEPITNPPADATFPLASIKLCAPIPKPTRIICVGLDYRDHSLLVPE
jgi:2-keto-4-pentenoate hydratase/2-oxohepta-3-ene-1,7-dioic acid hydratase in catechol pathway